MQGLGELLTAATGSNLPTSATAGSCNSVPCMEPRYDAARRDTRPNSLAQMGHRTALTFAMSTGCVMSTAVQSSALLTPSSLQAAMTACASATACGRKGRSPPKRLRHSRLGTSRGEPAVAQAPGERASALSGALSTRRGNALAHHVGGFARLQVLDGIELDPRNGPVVGFSRVQESLGDSPQQHSVLQRLRQPDVLRKGCEEERVEPLARIRLRQKAACNMRSEGCNQEAYSATEIAPSQREMKRPDCAIVREGAATGPRICVPASQQSARTDPRAPGCASSIEYARGLGI